MQHINTPCIGTLDVSRKRAPSTAKEAAAAKRLRSETTEKDKGVDKDAHLKTAGSAKRKRACLVVLLYLWAHSMAPGRFLPPMDMDGEESDGATHATVDEDGDQRRSEDERDQEEKDAEIPESDNNLLTATSVEAEKRMVEEVRGPFHVPIAIELTSQFPASTLGEANERPGSKQANFHPVTIA